MANKKHRGKLMRAERSAAVAALAGESEKCASCNGEGTRNGWTCLTCGGTGNDSRQDLEHILRDANQRLCECSVARLNAFGADALREALELVDSARSHLAVIEQRLRARRAGR